jgi:hypothetical protein
MKYREYRAAGYPIATDLIEGVRTDLAILLSSFE